VNPGSPAMAASTHLNLAFVACVPIVIGEILLAGGRAGVVVPILFLVAGVLFWAAMGWRSIGMIRSGPGVLRHVGIGAVATLVVVPVAGAVLTQLLL
jgi:hypothetical protein